MIYFTLIIPVLACLILLLKFRKETLSWEYALVAVPSIIIIVLMNTIMIHHRIGDTKYISKPAMSVKYYQPWNEYIHKRCSRTHCYGSGKSRHCHTTWYDCSYVSYHGKRWTLTANGREYDISEQAYNSLVSRFGTGKTFVDMNRRFYTQDGDMYLTTWNGSENTAYIIDDEISYTNKTRAFHELFHLEDITDEEKEKYRLYDYPEISNLKQKHVLSYTDGYLASKVDWINSKYNDRPFRLYILFFEGYKDVTSKQKSYWEGSNENELVLCVGIDSTTNTVTWANSFSWSPDKSFEDGLVDKVSIGARFPSEKVVDYINTNISQWRPKLMKDYDYLEVQVSETQLNWIVFILLLYNIGICYYIVINEHKYNPVSNINLRKY